MKAVIQMILAAVLIAVLPLAGCSPAGPTGIIIEEKDFTDFTRVRVEGTFTIEIARSDTFSTTISADSSFFDYVAVDKEGDTLRIYLNPHHTFTDFTLQARTLKAKITMPVLRELQLAGASKGTISGFNSTEDLKLNISGASNLNTKDIEADGAELEISGASEINGNLNAGDTRLTVSGASKVTIKGAASNIIVDASGASKIDMAGFPVQNADVTLSGASEATLNIKGELDTVLRDASRLYFLGNPTMGNISISGASTIKHK
ncbi:MAG: head GIN domain-containing protein [Dehalococcoidales bacterium]|nr:head GIN domain-containing protein [Dehalococcoidales bacterium]MDZ4230383.1 head GIN domain-containing protein [Dehalococcoidales bacterium]